MDKDNGQSPTDVWNWSRQFPDSEDDAHVRLHIGIRISFYKDDGLVTAAYYGSSKETGSHFEGPNLCTNPHVVQS
jgi:hypothetical protein